MRQSLTGRISLVLLAVLAAVMAHPWHTPRERWVLGIAVATVVVVLAWWRGLFFTTMVRRRLAMLRRNHMRAPLARAGVDVYTTALLRIVNPPEDEPDLLPLPLIARYLDRYGIRAAAVRVTSRESGGDNGVPQRDTWIGLTLSAADNLAALQARSSNIPLHQTAEVAVRRLADHLREIGWAASPVESDDVPTLFARPARETWRGVKEASGDYVAAYRVKADETLLDTLAVIRSYPARETWTALEISGTAGDQTLAVACAFRTNAHPAGGAPISGLTPQSGNHRPALVALDPTSTERLDGHSDLPDGLLGQLRWPSTVARQSRPRHAAL
ncbi:type VII secretion protein EccE [Mycobacterium branderi]|uniref:Type VII secretion protein EccE n=1 Tax=Mycobacterium branderi TaxID=43348 RepID=A0A7I7W0A0_9MYCO|nr:type VII secretion protein EccE [Mycobacterium branderi]ORA37990.1 type VII secretion protein EccE [Mycobacterium branderi]BBZ10989.1 type VII secretion protein EccE [Mycobacterium branderi]